MTKYFKRLLFWLFILILIGVACYLTPKAYVQANCSRAINYLVEKYEINEKDLKGIKFQEYVYEDITNCDSLWLKKCSSDKDLVYEYVLKNTDNVKITVKEYKNGDMDDDFEKGTIRKEYLEKLDRQNNKENSTEDNKEETN